MLQLAIHARFKATFEIKGSPALLNKHGGYDTCGTEAKIPRLQTVDEIQDYMKEATVFYTPFKLRQVIDSLTKGVGHTATFCEPCPCTAPPHIFSLSEDQDSQTIPTATTTYSDIVMHPVEKYSDTGGCITVSESNDTAVWEADPCKRMNRTGWQLSCSLKRPATEAEIWEAYHQQNQNTDEDHDRNRRKLCKESAEWCALNFDPTKQKSFDLDTTLELVRKFVTPEIRKEIHRTNRKTYTDEQLAATLHVIEREAVKRNRRPHYQFTVPNNSILAMFDCLGVEIEGTEKVIRNRLSAIKRVLVAAGLAEVVDANWYDGKGKCYGLGSNHPRYDEYVSLKQIMKAEEKIDADIVILTKKKRNKAMK